MGESVELEKIAGALELERDKTKEILDGMIKRYEQDDTGLQIIELDAPIRCVRKAKCTNI